MRAKRVDANQPEIVAFLRKCGFSVAITSDLGKGFPDLVIGRNGVNYLIEVKDGKKPASAQKLTEAEQKFHDEWRGDVRVISSIDDCINLNLVTAYYTN